MRERDIEAYLCRLVSTTGGEAYKFISPGRNGVPDRLVMLPSGRVYFAEVKNPDGRLSPVQEIEHARLRALGQTVVTIYTKAQAEQIVRAWR